MGHVGSEHSLHGLPRPVTAQLTSVTVPALWARVVANGVRVSIRESDGGTVTFSFGSLIEHIDVPPPSDAAPDTVSVVTAISSAQPTLRADTLYFLGLSAGSSGFDVSDVATEQHWHRGRRRTRSVPTIDDVDCAACGFPYRRRTCRSPGARAGHAAAHCQRSWSHCAPRATS